MLDAYNLILKWNPTFTFSNRNLVNFAERFCLLMQNCTPSTETIYENLWYAAVAEFAWTTTLIEQMYKLK